MKCTVSREQLLTPLTHTERTTGKQMTLPVLSCILTEVHDAVLSLTATNLEVGVRYRIPVADASDGRVAVPASIFLHVVSALPSGASLTLEADGGVLVIKSVRGTTRITLQDAEDYPALPVVGDGIEQEFPTKGLRDALTGVAYCASTSSIKPELASVYLHPQGSVLVAAATDSFRLAERRVSLKLPVSTDPILIPARSVADVVRVLDQVGDKVHVRLNEHQCSIESAGLYMTTRLTSGTFPDYTAIIPKEFSTEATLLRVDFEQVLKKATAFSDQFNQTTLTVDPNKKLFSVHTENSTVGETTDNIPATLEGEEIDIRFNHRYLLEALHTITADSVIIRFSGRSHPALVQPMGDSDFLYLVMPMNR